MIEKIIRFSAENRYLVIAATIVALALAWWSMRTIPLDALPDLSDTQVIVYARWDRSPDIIEDQVTYPITTALLGAPKVKAIRGFSDFGFSYVYVIFEDGTDMYWARTRVLEYVSKVTSDLPAGVKVELGPDASAVGWVFQYALVDNSGTHSSDELRSYQDWFLRYAVQSVPGVSEVATVGGQVRQYQVTVNPNQLVAYQLPLDAVIKAVRTGNNDVGGRLVEISGREYMVRGRGYVKDVRDIEEIVLRSTGGTPVLIKDVARVALGPEMRRGVADYNGRGDAVGGIVVMRHGENALNVIERIKAKLEEVKPSLPAGVEIVTTYDRSELIERAIETVKDKLIEEIIIVSIIILIFLWHFPSSIVPIVTIPVSVALAFIPMKLMGLNANLMSLAGIAISIGVLVDGAIVEVENAYNKIHHWQEGGRKGDFHQIRLEALLEVGPGVFFSLLVIAVAFMPVFTLIDQEGRLFRPLAYSKNLAMAIAALLAITLDPAMRMLFARIDPFTFRPRALSWLATQLLVGRYYSEERHPISRLLHRLYEGPCRAVLRHPRATIGLAALMVVSTIPVYLQLGSEFMPPLQEGAILYMPSAVEPGMSVAEAQQALQLQDKILMTFPEVERVFGKAGRANTSTDPAPFTMMETTILLKPESAWRTKASLVLALGPELVGADVAPVLARPDQPSRAGRRDEPGATDPRDLQRLDHADQGSTGHVVDRDPHAGRDQDHGRRSLHHRADRQRDRSGGVLGARDAERLRRAGRGWVLPRLRPEAGEVGALRPLRRRRQHDGHDRRRRRQPKRHGRGAGALRHQCPLRPGLSRRSAGPATGPPPAPQRNGPDPDGRDRRRGAGPGALDDPRRKRPPRGVRIRRLRYGADRRRPLRRPGQGGGGGEGQGADRLLHGLERPV
jgi:Cu(I)/Ag(I) efflux system membrane protein CusA/SilA